MSYNMRFNKPDAHQTAAKNSLLYNIQILYENSTIRYIVSVIDKIYQMGKYNRILMYLT